MTLNKNDFYKVHVGNPAVQEWFLKRLSNRLGRTSPETQMFIGSHCGLVHKELLTPLNRATDIASGNWVRPATSTSFGSGSVSELRVLNSLKSNNGRSGWTESLHRTIRIQSAMGTRWQRMYHHRPFEFIRSALDGLQKDYSFEMSSIPETKALFAETCAGARCRVPNRPDPFRMGNIHDLLRSGVESYTAFGGQMTLVYSSYNVGIDGSLLNLKQMSQVDLVVRLGDKYEIISVPVSKIKSREDALAFITPMLPHLEGLTQLSRIHSDAIFYYEDDIKEVA